MLSGIQASVVKAIPGSTHEIPGGGATVVSLLEDIFITFSSNLVVPVSAIFIGDMDLREVILPLGRPSEESNPVAIGLKAYPAVDVKDQLPGRPAKDRHHVKSIRHFVLRTYTAEVEMIAIRREGESEVVMSKRIQYLSLSVGRCISHPQCSLPFVVFHLGQEACVC
jgi:hypothetical protein